MEKAWALYEQKILKDEEFPIQLYTHRVNKKCCYFPTHWHEHIEMHYVISGKCRIKLDQEEIMAREGDLVIANSNVLHVGYCEEGMLTDLSMIFALDDISRELAEKNVIFSSLIREMKKSTKSCGKSMKNMKNSRLDGVRPAKAEICSCSPV